MGSGYALSDYGERKKKLLIAVEVGRNASAFDCGKCRQKNCDATGKLPGSIGPAGFPRWEINGEEMRTCPLPLITAFSREMLRLHIHYRAGKLWDGGGLRDQPAAYLKAMEIIESHGG